MYEGFQAYPLANGDTNENVIGNGAIGHGSNTTTLGNASVTDTYIAGTAHIGTLSNGTTATTQSCASNDLVATGAYVAACASGGGSSPLTTKGDIYGYTTTNARVPVGADGTVLGADSTQALGVGYKDMPSVLITDPPYNAACDGSTDDSTAIQAAINSGKVVNFPLSTTSDFQQCNVATPLTGPSSGSPLVIHGNGSELNFTSSGDAVFTFGSLSTSVDNLVINTQTLTGSAMGINETGGLLELNNVTISAGSSGIGTGGAAYYAIYGANSFIVITTNNLWTDGTIFLTSGPTLVDQNTIFFAPSGWRRCL